MFLHSDGRPSAIDIMTDVKGLHFSEAFKTSQIIEAGTLNVRVIGLNQLLKAKRAAGRHRDLDDIDNPT